MLESDSEVRAASSPNSVGSVPLSCVALHGIDRKSESLPTSDLAAAREPAREAGAVSGSVESASARGAVQRERAAGRGRAGRGGAGRGARRSYRSG